MAFIAVTTLLLCGCLDKRDGEPKDKSDCATATTEALWAAGKIEADCDFEEGRDHFNVFIVRGNRPDDFIQALTKLGVPYRVADREFSSAHCALMDAYNARLTFLYLNKKKIDIRKVAIDVQ